MRTRLATLLFALAVISLFVPAAFASSGGTTLDTVDVAFFYATSEGRSVRLIWETFSEENALGFNIYRAKRPDGPRVKLNDSLIAARFAGSHMGAAYELVDNTGRSRVFYYWLEVVDSDLNAVEHGPVSGHVSFLRPTRARPHVFSSLGQASSWVPRADSLHGISVQP